MKEHLKEQQVCIFCGADHYLIPFKGEKICACCIEELKK